MEIFGSPPTNITTLSPSSAARDLRVQLPTTTDPPGPNNPPKQLVWLVRTLSLPFVLYNAEWDG